MSLISSLFGPLGRRHESPWTDESIYNLLESHLDPVSGRLRPPDLELPDEETFRDENLVSWAAGALDGVAGRHFGIGSE